MNGQGSRIFRWAWARRATALLFLLLLVLGKYEWFPWFKGATTATTACRIIPFADPLAALEVTLATRSLETSLLWGAGLVLTLGIVAGPVFCGWVCPLGLLLDLNQTLRRRLMRLLFPRERRLPDLRLPAEVKYGVWGLVIGFALVARLPAFQTLSPINIVAWAVVFSAWPAMLVVAALAVVEHVAPRVWCRSLCPLGAMYALIGRFGVLRVRVNPGGAGNTPCGQCTLHCPMGIRVTRDYVLPEKPAVDHPDCTRCGECVDVCPSGVLRLGVRTTPPSGAAAEKRHMLDAAPVTRQADCGSREEVS